MLPLNDWAPSGAHDRQPLRADGDGKLGYAPEEVEQIVAFVDERNSVVGAPLVRTEHYPVFDCAVGERAIHYTGHVKMMGAVQPFISGAIAAEPGFSMHGRSGLC